MNDQPKGPSVAEDVVTIKPTLQFNHNRAWSVDLPAALKAKAIDPETNGCLALWIVEAPWAHPFWHSYAIGLIHMRDEPKLPKVLRYRADATHEMFVYALDPAKPREPVVITGDASFLTPKNFAAQFQADTDALAMERIEACVREIISGALSPDTDYMRAWIKRFNDSMLIKRPENFTIGQVDPTKLH